MIAILLLNDISRLSLLFSCHDNHRGAVNLVFPIDAQNNQKANIGHFDFTSIFGQRSKSDVTRFVLYNKFQILTRDFEEMKAIH